MTRAESALTLSRILDLATDTPDDDPFTDIPSHHPSAAEIDAVKTAGIFQADTQGAFLPDRSLTRGEAAAVMVRAYELAPASPPATPQTH